MVAACRAGTQLRCQGTNVGGQNQSGVKGSSGHSAGGSDQPFGLQGGDFDEHAAAGEEAFVGAVIGDDGVAEYEVSEAKRLRQLEEENGQLKHIVAEQAVDIRALKAVVAKKW
jgi:hypothetical protein